MSMRRASSLSIHCHSRGITLIEMLVSLVILSACMALVSSVAFQVSKVLNTVQNQNQASLPAFMLHHQVIDSALQRAVVGRNSSPANFVGDADRVEFTTETHPLGAPDQPQNLLLRIDKNELRMVAPAGAEQLVLSGTSQLRWVFFDEAMASHANWPPLGVERPAKLPRALLVQDEQKRVLAQWVLLGPKFAHPSLGQDAEAFIGRPSP